jgi:hypothetical protein
MSNLTNLSRDLESSLVQLTSVCKSLNGKRSETIKLQGLLQLMTGQLAELRDIAEEVDISIKARDETIAALGEKLSQQHQKKAKPFFVPPPERRGSPEPETGVFKPEEHSKWNVQRRATLQNGMIRELARLSILPMGLQGKEHEEMLEEVVADLRHKNKMLPSIDEEAEKAAKAKTHQRALDLIAVSESNDVPREKSRAFLRQKGLTNDEIDKCFSVYDSQRAAKHRNRTASPPDRLDRMETFESEDEEEDEDSLMQYDLRFGKSSAGTPTTPGLVRDNSAQAC